MFFFYRTKGLIPKVSLLTEYFGSNDDFQNMGILATVGQSFQVGVSGTANAVEIFGARGGASSGTFSIQILTGSMVGTVISDSGSINSATLTPFASGAQWNRITMPPVALTTGVTYYLRLTALTGSTNDEVRWSVDNTSPTYANGESFAGTTPVPTSDNLFRILSL